MVRIYCFLFSFVLTIDRVDTLRLYQIAAASCLYHRTQEVLGSVRHSCRVRSAGLSCRTCEVIYAEVCRYSVN